MTNRASIGQVLEQLEDEGFVQVDNIQSWESEEFSDTSPWFIQGLMGCGGWIAAWFFLGFSASCISTLVFFADERAYGWIFLILGLILTSGTIFAKSQKSSSGAFASQLLLAIHVAGHLLIIGGVFMALELWNYDSVITLTAMIIIVVELIFLYLYPDPILRFLATLAIVVALNMLVFDLGIIGSLSILTACLAFLAMIIWGDLLNPEQQIRFFPLLHPVGYALVLGMFGTIIHEVSFHYGIYLDYSREMLYQPVLTSILLLILLVWTEIRLLQDYDVSTRANYVLAIIAITILVAVPTMTTPGIVAGLLIVVLAFRRNNWILLGIAYLFFAGFIIEYYYSLEVTLLTKSIILMVTGVLLILGRLFLRRIVTVPDGSEGGVA